MIYIVRALEKRAGEWGTVYYEEFPTLQRAKSALRKYVEQIREMHTVTVNDRDPEYVFIYGIISDSKMIVEIIRRSE